MTPEESEYRIRQIEIRAVLVAFILGIICLQFGWVGNAILTGLLAFSSMRWVRLFFEKEARNNEAR